MSEKPEVSQGMRIAGAIGGVVVGAIVGALAVAGAALVGHPLEFAGTVPSALAGGIAGGCIGLALGMVFPAMLARALGALISGL